MTLPDEGPAAEGTPSEPVTPPPPPARSRRRRWGRIALVLLLVAPVAGELFARFYLGLGDPPLSIADPQIEYLFKPDQDCRRFGNHIHYNHYSMRADDFPAHKSRPGELRVLVVGDSVINGGVLTDQARTATAILQERLSEALGRPVVVGNISAGSWGPPNQLAYLKRFGLFDADVVVFVFSSHDAADVPTFAPIVGVDPAYPDHKPWSALWEGVERYLLPRLRHRPASNEGFTPPATEPSAHDVEACLAAIREMFEMARRAGVKVVVAQHLERTEPSSSPRSGHAAIAAEAARFGLNPVQLGPAFEAARGRGEHPDRDDIHPNDLGQRLIADALFPAIEAALAAPATRPTTAVR